MKAIKGISKWVVWNAAWVGCGWFGYQEGVVWAENLFVFSTWFFAVMAILIAVILGVFKAFVDNGDFAGDKLVEFHQKFEKEFYMPRIFGILLDGVVIAFLASLGHFVLATAVMVMLFCNSYMYSCLKDVRATAKEYYERRMRRTNSPVITEDHLGNSQEGVFNDDEENELFRMGITTRETER
jgi:hypothetical protein